MTKMYQAAGAGGAGAAPGGFPGGAAPGGFPGGAGAAPGGNGPTVEEVD